MTTRPLLTFWIRFTSPVVIDCFCDYFKDEFNNIVASTLSEKQRLDAILFDSIPSEADLHALHLSYPEAHMYFLSNETPQGSTSGRTYIHVPVSFPDLAHMLHTPRPAVSYDVGAFVFFPSARRLHNKHSLHIDLLTEKEADVLLYLLKNHEASKEELLENVWGYKSDTTTHTLETHIYNLRQKLQSSDDPSLLVTTSRGYQLKGNT